MKKFGFALEKKHNFAFSCPYFFYSLSHTLSLIRIHDGAR